MKPIAMIVAAAVSAAVFAGPAAAALSYATFAFSAGNPVTLTINGSTTLTATNTGWYTNAGDHNAANPNYIAGVCGSSDFCNGDNVIRRNYFAFDLTSITGPVTSAKISALQNPLPNAGYISLSPSITFTNYDVSTSFASLISTQTTATGTYNDLGTGTIYAVTTIFSSSNGSLVDITLNAAGIAALNNSIGGNFILGGSVDQASGAVPEPASWAMMIAGFGLVGAAMRRRNVALAA